MEYSELAALYQRLEATSKRLEKTHAVACWLPEVKENELGHVILLLQGKVFPSYDDRKIGVADKLVIKAVSLASGANGTAIEKVWKKTGDLGEAAEELLAKRKQHSLFSQPLSTEKVFGNIQKLATLEGSGTVDAKVKLIAELLTNAKLIEAKYIIRTLLEDLRIGLGEGTLRDGMIWAYLGKELGLKYDKAANDFDLDENEREKYNEAAGKVQAALDITNDFSIVARLLKEHGLKKLGSVEMEPGRPVKVMLAQKAVNFKEGFETVGLPCRVEYKYDGFRMEIHIWKENGKRKARLFTRRLENVTAQFPEVEKLVLQEIRCDSAILDSEAIGYDGKTGKYRPFQEISQRIRRKYDIDKLAEELPVEINVFDVLYYNGKSMIGEPFRKRRETVEKVVPNMRKKIIPSVSEEVNSEGEAEKIYKESLKAGNEGVMLKSLDAVYKPGSRVGYMLKLKPVLDTLDLFIVKAEWGEGKRSQWLSSFTLACLDDDSGELVEVGKVGTGIKELEEQKESEGQASFEQLTQLLKPLIKSEKGREVTVKARVLLEISFEEIQKSPSYGSGYALRFPRVIRIREDKDDPSTLNEMERIFKHQKGKT